MRSNPRKTPRRGRRQARNLSLLVLFVIVLAVLIIISPSEPTKSALNVNAQGQVVSIYEGLVISEAMSIATDWGIGLDLGFVQDDGVGFDDPNADEDLDDLNPAGV